MDNLQQKAALKMVDLAEMIFICPFYSNRKWKPGQIFQSLPEETKELLKHLKSDDLKKVRWEW